MKIVLTILAFTMLTLPETWAAVYNKDVWRARDNGAETDVTIRVVDDGGRPVADARCGGWLYLERDSEHGRGYAEYTDEKGCARVVGRCSEWFSVVVRKEGYYRTMFEVKYPLEDVDPPIVDGKWQPYGGTRTVVLKKIGNPTAMSVADKSGRRGYPELGKWVGYDLSKHDWVAPDGNGVCSDMKIRFTEQRFSGLDFARTMEVSFEDVPHGGAYLMHADEDSELRTAYAANTNATFLSRFRYEFKHKGRELVQDELKRNQYLVFRTRTEVHPDGSLKSAHYGVIMGNWRFHERYGMSISEIRFNPVPNDTNLEDAETARKSRLGYRQSMEFARRREAEGK